MNFKHVSVFMSLLDIHLCFMFYISLGHFYFCYKIASFSMITARSAKFI